VKDCLYHHFDTNGVLLYVGVSLAPISRLQHHSVSSEWFDEIVTITIERLSSREAAFKAERFAIETEKPRYNTAHLNQQWRERQTKAFKERLTAAKAKGVKFGRKAKLDDNQEKAIQADVKAGELSMQAIADKYGIARNSVYRLAGAKEANTAA
jgi:hypothetical protein